MLSPRVLLFITIALLAPTIGIQAARPSPGGRQGVESVCAEVQLAQPSNVVRPDEALGAAVDGQDYGEVPLVYTPRNEERMRSSGLKSLTYRIRTELADETWHWNSAGRWSDPASHRGYWVSDWRTPIRGHVTYGYRLPRRGNTIDQANNDGYSVLTDGDRSTFWKSNPYLDHRYTHEPDARHPQWIVVDLGKRRAVNAIRIEWADPFAVQYCVQWWDGKDAQDTGASREGTWRTFPGGTVTRGAGGTALLVLDSLPRSVRYTRIWMTAGSGTPCLGGRDPRDRCGYAVREVYVGTVGRDGRFTDLVRHGRDRHRQTRIIVSSTDPWHRAKDRDRTVEQPAFDLVFGSGLTNGLPVLVPACLLFDTPENAVGSIRYLLARRYPIRGIEMGEEPDGQLVTPEDYGALYVQWAQAIHRVRPDLKLGGPCFQSTLSDAVAWPDSSGDTSWLRRFLHYLRAANRLGDLRFFSMEWYPFDDLTRPPYKQLRKAPKLLGDVMRRLQSEGLTRDMPWLITEYGYSAYSGPVEMRVEAALLNAEIVARFLTLGGTCAYLYGYEPTWTFREEGGSKDWGALTLFFADDRRQATWPTPAFYAARMLACDWLTPTHAEHGIFPVRVFLPSGGETPDVTAYAARRPDGEWSVLLLNKSPTESYSVRVQFAGANDSISSFTGPVELCQYGSSDYE